MGNTDSHSSFTSPAKSSYSIRFSSRREEAPSARSWWRSGQGGGRSRGRTGAHQHPTDLPYASWHYEHDPRASRLGAGSPQRCRRGEGPQTINQSGFLETGTSERSSLASGGSPKVLLSKDGAMRVEFTKARLLPMEPQGPPGLQAPVASGATETSLRTSNGSSLSSNGSWYDSPWGTGGELEDSVFVCGESVANGYATYASTRQEETATSGGYATYASTRQEETATSVGYASTRQEETATSGGYATYASTRPEETATIGGGDAFFSTRQEETATSGGGDAFFSTRTDASAGLSSGLLCPSPAGTGRSYTCSSSRTEDSGIGDSVILQPELKDFALVSASGAAPDVYSSCNTLPAFPTAASSTALLGDVTQEEVPDGGAGQLYSSFTLPCRRVEAATGTGTSRNNRKDFLKSRIRQLSDWTGSLSRKKRRIQDGRDPGGVFVTSLDSLWTPNPLNQVPAAHPPNLGQSSDLQRQNVYDSFMQELETGCSRTEPSEGDREEEEEVEWEVEVEVPFEEEQGVVRRAGWLHFKTLLAVNKDRKLELVARRKWRRYWVTLKGCTLLFYETYGKTLSSDRERSPRYALLADDSIVQAVPEHPKKEHVFCLSNSHGDVYLLQATNQTDLENWVTAIHSASASLLAKRQGREDTLRLLRCRSRSLLHQIDTDGKMKKMAELQLSVIREQSNRRAVETQIQQWEQNLEKLNMDLFRLRCYQSSLQGGELPNPKSLLALASRPSKSMLGRLGVFSVSSFHALVCSRERGALRSRTLSGGAPRRRGLPSSLKSLDGLNRPSRSQRNSSTQRLDCVSNQKEAAPSAGCAAALQSSDESQPSIGGVFTLSISRHDGEDFGFAVTGHLDGGGRSHVFVSEVDPLAKEGLRAGDEVLAVNGAAVSGLDLDLMQSVFSRRNLQLLLRRDESPGAEEAAITAAWPDPGDPCRPPAARSLSMGALCWVLPLEDEEPEKEEGVVGGGLALLDGTSCCLSRHCPDDSLVLLNVDRVFSLYQTFPEGRAAEADLARNLYCREAGLPPASPAHLSVCQRLRKVIQELVDTEKSYVKDLVCLFDVYLTPLQTEAFLTKDEMEALFGCLPEMLDFQRVFLQTLEERIAACPNFSRLETPGQFKKLLFSLGGSFLYYADHFKHYSGFCANHIKVQKVLERAKTDGAFKHFLETRNPTNQHSSSLESYLIKPVQRVLKYPLLLKELVSLTVPESPEHTHLTEALRAMEKVASHINEMQKIYEDYGSVFDQLAAEQSGPHRQVTEISMGEFLVHSSVVWLNPLAGLGRPRKEPELTLFVFKRAVILVYRESSKLKKRMNGSRSADLDPFRFRWLIPVSAVQVRPASLTGAENPCVWELVHSRSELEGRPETVFQLCSSGLEAKASVLRALRSLRTRHPSGSLRRRRLSTAERRRQQRGRPDSQRARRQPEEGHRAGGGETCSEPLLPSHASCGSPGRRTRLCSLTNDLEAQLQRLNFTEGGGERAAAVASSGGAERRRSSGVGGPAGDLLDRLERGFSVQSVSSMINEDCFYDAMTGVQTGRANASMLTQNPSESWNQFDTSLIHQS